MELAESRIGPPMVALIVALVVAILAIIFRDQLEVIEFIVITLLIALNVLVLTGSSPQAKRLEAKVSQLCQHILGQDGDTISWAEFSIGVQRVQEKIEADNAFQPDVVVSVGRSGAIAGALLAGNLGELLHIGIDRLHQNVGGNRVTTIVPPVRVLADLLSEKNVLIVMTECIAGGTLHEAQKALETQVPGIRNLRSAAVFRARSAAYYPSYVGAEHSGKELFFRTNQWTRSSILTTHLRRADNE